MLGERWTLLVVRNLLMGPQRHTDLREALPGIATDLLTARLRTLEDAGYVQRHKLPPPTPVTVYQLTDTGQRLRPLLLELARLGINRLGPPPADQDIRPSAVVLSLSVTVQNRRLDVARGQASSPRCTISTNARLLAQLLSGAIEPAHAISTGELALDGPRTELERFLQTLAYPTASSTPA